MQTVDFFTPIVDDPYTFGQIAAANSLSDVYAMGAKPLTALNIICFPASCHPLSLMEEILRGGYDKVKEAGAVILGGHSIEDNEPKYGLAVTGLVRIDRLITSGGACPDDLLVLTKPIGTGILATAIKGGLLNEAQAATAIRGMATLNAAASRVMCDLGVSACTDITGFSLLGHLHEMLMESGVSAELDYQAVPLYPQTEEMAAQGMIPAGAYRNLDYIRQHLQWSGSAGGSEDKMIILADPQTSGGLLVALSQDKVEKYLAELAKLGGEGRVIGRITADQSGKISIS